MNQIIIVHNIEKRTCMHNKYEIQILKSPRFYLEAYKAFYQIK